MTQSGAFRIAIYLGTLLTGATGLIYQVVWQRYYAFIVGSDARSVTLVVTVFLIGLASGYAWWGRRTRSAVKRQRLLRLYGLIEIGIGVYAALFPFYARAIQSASYNGPVGYLTDAAATVAGLILPTFLMGATVPLLVAIVPTHNDEVHSCHARIYGVNTLGACLGALGASFVLIPRFGLSGTLWLGALVNLFIGLVFVANSLRGTVVRSEPLEAVPSRFGARTLYAYTLTTGTVVLALEVVLVRLLNLGIGAGPHNFALVVAVFVLGLGLGSLIVSGRTVGVTTLFRAMAFVIGYLIVLFYSVPYWPYWLSNLRATLSNIPISYPIYMTLVAGFLVLLLLPLLIPLGFMLPLAYSFLPKSANDYGEKCGRMYFFNTVGTALGAIGLAYFALLIVDLDTVFKLTVLLLTALAVLLSWQERRMRMLAVVAVAGVAFMLAPGWDRTTHYQGLFGFPRVSSFNFRGLFHKVQLAQERVFLTDGPDVTVSVVGLSRRGADGREVTSRALFNNGRSEGDSVADYSTVTLLGLLPYLLGPERSDLEVAVIGLGTGATAGLLGQSRDVARVEVVEIAGSVIRAAREFADDNHGLLDNDRAALVSIDGFKYLARRRAPLDLVVSEPSVPWVVGVENLFTADYYRLVRATMAEDGLFVQWFPLYTVDQDLFRSIAANLVASFPHVQTYRLSEADLGIVASPSPIPLTAHAGRLAEPTLLEAAGKMGFVDVNQLAALRVYGSSQLRFLVREKPARPHTLDRPGLAHVSDRVRTVGVVSPWDSFFDPRIVRFAGYDSARGAALDELSRRFPAGLTCSGDYGGSHLFCTKVNELLSDDRRYSGRDGAGDPASRLAAYERLRDAGMRAEDPDFLRRITARLAAGEQVGQERTAMVDRLILALVKDGRADTAELELQALARAGHLSEHDGRRLFEAVQLARAGYSRFAAAYRATSGP